MKRKHILFCVAIVLVVTAIRFLFRLIYHVTEADFGSEDRFIKRSINCTLVILVCIFIAHKLKIEQPGGFIRPRVKNFYLVLLPVLFPGLLFISGFQLNCNYTVFHLLWLIYGTFIVALMEEIIFRGIMFGYLVSRAPYLSPRQVCVITALFFSLLHLGNLEFAEASGVFAQLIYAFYMGLIFSALQFRVNSVWILGLAHGLINFFNTRCPKVEEMVGEDVVMAANNDPSLVAQLLTALLLFSPALLIFWLLTKGLSTRDKATPAKSEE